MRLFLILILALAAGCASTSGGGAGISTPKPAQTIAFAKVMNIVDSGQQSPPHHRIVRICAARGGLVSSIKRSWTQLWPTGPAVPSYSFSCEEKTSY